MNTPTSPNQLGPYQGIILLGGGGLLSRLCQWATENNFPVKVITSPRHASELIDGTPLSEFLTGINVEFLETQSIKTEEVTAFVGDTTHTFCLSLGAAWIFRPKLIARLFHNRLFNLHGSRLPQNRGGGGFSWQIMTANRFGFCVLHMIDGGIDTGDVVSMEEFLYPVTCNFPADFMDYYIEKNFEFITDILGRARTEVVEVKPFSQSEYFSSYWPRLNTSINGWINWSMEMHQLQRFITAFDDPYTGAQTFWGDEVIHVKKASLNLQDGVYHSYQRGIVYRKAKDWICVCLEGGALVIETVVDKNGDSLIDKINVGDRFYTPQEQLENIGQRVRYNPSGLMDDEPSDK